MALHRTGSSAAIGRPPWAALGARGRRLAAAITALTAAALLGFTACEGGEEEFLACPLDPAIDDLGLCTSDTEGVGVAEQSCVAPSHPQCPRSVCLSWAGSDPVCTYTCSADTDCDPQAVCRRFGPPAADGTETRYCVQIAALRCDRTADCPGGAACVDPILTDDIRGRCVPPATP